MPGKTAREAYDNNAKPLKSVLSCVTKGYIHAKRGFGAEESPALFAFNENPAPLNESVLRLFFLQSFYVGPDQRAPGEFKVFTCMYRYEVCFHSARSRDEIIAYHWEPTSSAVAYPHIHIGFGVRDLMPPFDPKNHIPSGRVPIEDLVCMLIQEMGVPPLRDNWREIVGCARTAFMQNKSW